MENKAESGCYDNREIGRGDDANPGEACNGKPWEGFKHRSNRI